MATITMRRGRAVVGAILLSFLLTSLRMMPLPPSSFSMWKPSIKHAREHPRTYASPSAMRAPAPIATASGPHPPWTAEGDVRPAPPSPQPARLLPPANATDPCLLAQDPLPT
jgi:hypothetical protein